jgi:hypothetical protein
LNLAPGWLGAYPGYMISKYSMTLATLGLAHEFADQGLRPNCDVPSDTSRDPLTCVRRVRHGLLPQWLGLPSEPEG